MLRRSARALLFSLACASCSGAPPPNNEKPPTPPAENRTYYVSPNGDDAANGERATPVKTIGRALQLDNAARIVVDEGHYQEKLDLRQQIELYGPGESKATLDGSLSIAADAVIVHGLDVTGGVRVSLAKGVVFEDARVTPGEQDSAVGISSAQVSLRYVNLGCGDETCIEVVTSTVQIDHAFLYASGTSKRGLRVESSSVTARNLTATGGQINQAQVGRRGYLTVLDSRFEGAGSSALAAIQGGKLMVERATISGADQTGAILSQSDAVLRDVVFGTTRNVGLGVQGGDITLINCTIEPSPHGGMTVNDHPQRPASVLISGGVIKHARVPGLSLGQGKAIVRGTRFTGDASADGDDAIMASGPTAELTVDAAYIDTPAGFGVGFYNNAYGSVTATITRPRLGGILADNAAGGTIRVAGSVVTGCGRGSGIVAFDAPEVEVLRFTASGCREAGVLAGQNAHVSVNGAKLTGNSMYGLAAFGGAEIDVTRAVVRGSPWATFASCAEGARVNDGGNNTFEGPTTSCP